MTESIARPGNLLHQETSPYLLQHADNPVHWRPWGQAALAEAQATGRAILLSIGYAACHWCHVMAHESFEDSDTAALMNRLYVCVKVDREERPDIDHLYMSALHALGEQGGWPLTMFLTPEGAPFWGGTYFPPTPRYGRPSFQQVLAGVADAWVRQHDTIRHNTAAITKALAAMSAARPGDLPGPEALDHAAAALLRITDADQGGMRGAPKFPNPPIFRFLWQTACRTGAPAPAEAVHLLLRRMSLGGIYDHLGGGYARYATDAVWLVPHFEKMLYDNAQILDLLALAHAAAPDPLYAARAEEMVGWLTRDMQAAALPDGSAAFAASEDADSEGEEGRFYVWTEAEIDALLGAAAAPFKQAYDVTAAGNWEGHTILHRVGPPEAPFGTAAEEAALAGARATLLQARGARVRPGRDDKVLADWNGWTIAALCRAAAVFDRPAWLALATSAYGFVRTAMMPAPSSADAADDPRVAHAWRLGRVTAAGLLDDQAAIARAAIALFEATGRGDYLADAAGLADAALHWFADADGSFFTTASDASDVPLGPAARPRSAADNATPAGNGVMAEVLARLFLLTGEDRWRQRAEAVITAFAGAGDALTGMPTLLAAADLLAGGTCVVVAGDPAQPAAQALLSTALAAADPAVCVLRAAAPDAVPPGHPAFGKTAPGGPSGEAGAAAYVCRGSVCSLPVRDGPSLAAALRRATTPMPAGG